MPISIGLDWLATVGPPLLTTIAGGIVRQVESVVNRAGRAQGTLVSQSMKISVPAPP